MNLPQAAMNWGDANETYLATSFPLHRACRDGDVEKLGSLLETGDYDLYEEDDFYGWTPIHWCSYFGKLACLRRMINQLDGAGVKACDLISSRFSQTPSHLCAYAGHPQCLYWLLQVHCNINIQDYLGETPTHKAARTGSMECLSLLVSQGADLSVRNHNDNTASHVAAAAGYVECAHYLERAAQIQAQAAGVYDEMRVPVTHPHCNGISPITNPLTQDKSTPQEMREGQVSAQQFISTNTYHSNPHLHTNGSLAHNNNNSVEAQSCDMEMEEEERGHGVTPWMMNTCQVPNGDVLLDQGVSQNTVPLAGKKRGREEVEEEIFKRARNDDTPGLRYKQTDWLVNNGHMTGQVTDHMTQLPSDSMEEHAASLVQQQGYDRFVIQTMSHRE